jgi:2-oxoglutarate ferredoxin oxidoreductase subunit beta
LFIALPYFVNGHGRITFTALSARVRHQPSPARSPRVLFGGDGDGFSIGGNHLDHGARKNINMTYFIMDNFVWADEEQTSPTSPDRFQSKTDPTGAIDTPVNPMKKLLRPGHLHRAHARPQVPHMIQ